MEYCIVSFGSNSFNIAMNKWVTTDKKFCYWPPIKTVGRCLKKAAQPQNDWQTLEVVAHFGPYGIIYKSLVIKKGVTFLSHTFRFYDTKNTMYFFNSEYRTACKKCTELNLGISDESSDNEEPAKRQRSLPPSLNDYYMDLDNVQFLTPIPPLDYG